MKVDLNSARARRLLLPARVSNLYVILIGCGGTGSWLAPHLARYLRLYKEVNPSTELKLYFVDPDAVEEKNTFRQNFVPAEIGRNKAEALAMRYTMSAGLPIIARACPFEKVHEGPLDQGSMVLYLGCVDNPAARRQIAKNIHYESWRRHSSYWIDCGNHKYSGQVLLSADGDASLDPFALKGLCTFIPPPSIFHPELFEDDAAAKIKPAKKLSCAELALLDQQSLSINTTVASIAAHYVASLLLTGYVDKFETHFDLEGNLPFNHRYLVPEEFQAWQHEKSKRRKNRSHGAGKELTVA